MHRVSHERDIRGRPSGAPNGRESTPHTLVRDQRMPIEFWREERLAVGERLGLRGFIESSRPPRLLGALDDERGMPRLVLVRVHAEEPVLVLPEVECERGEGLRRPEPDETVGTRIHRRREVLAQLFSYHGLQSVGADEQVDVRRDRPAIPTVRPREIGSCERRLERHIDTDCFRTLLEHGEEFLATHATEAMTGRANDLAPVVDVDVVPPDEVLGDRRVRLGVGTLDLRDGGVTEDDPKTERVVRSVLLLHAHFIRGVRPLHEDGEVQARRSPSNDVNLHSDAALASAIIFPAMMRCWISVVPS